METKSKPMEQMGLDELRAELQKSKEEIKALALDLCRTQKKYSELALQFADVAAERLGSCPRCGGKTLI